jgi:hypothetical protein
MDAQEVKGFIELTRDRRAERGEITLDRGYRKILPAGIELSNPLLVTGCLLKSYWWGNSPFDRREFVKRKKAGTLYEYKPATLSHVRTEFSKKHRRVRVIFTLTHPKPINLMQRALWLAGAVVYVFPDGDYRKKRQEIDHIISERWAKCVARLRDMGEVLPDGVTGQNTARVAG